MYISLNWIKDYVDLEGIDIMNLINNRFTLAVAEVEGVEVKGANLTGVVTAKIVSVADHPNSKKLHLLKVDKGDEVVDIVCGAPNVREGMIIPLATLGAKIGDITISTATLGGCVSNGMCCSAKELGISDDHSGLYEFDADTKIGVDVKSILPIDDIVFEIDNKSLTNRPDLWGHYGIAREIAALVHRPLKKLSLCEEDVSKLPSLDIKVTSDTCFRYTSATMNNITKKYSPMEMQIRLYYTGMRGINMLADVTNYVMLELGQPMHAFNNALVQNIQVENVTKDTEFTTLDNEKRVLPKDTMVIKGNGEISAIAGIMGGLDSEITLDTNSVLIESACFESSKVRKTAISLGLRTEASSRYEKSLDPELTMIALKRYMYLVKSIDSGANITSSITDVN
ncbi:MAG: phenylalanine--tRNA ligase subunit beta, partial [Clostridia bacterium]|nr:phenylalanine--tRNA ligase subunit beta [Clostridia bacterium]